MSTFGDIALAIGADFKKYADVVLATLQQASVAQVDKVSAVSLHIAWNSNSKLQLLWGVFSFRIIPCTVSIELAYHFDDVN